MRGKIRKTGRPHREHRSKKGRKPRRDFHDFMGNRDYKRQKEKLRALELEKR